MSKFGWSYPPGAANDPMAPYNQEEVPDNWLLSEAFSDYESIGELYRKTYKYTACGPSVGALVTYYREPTVEGFDQWDYGDTVSEWFYCSDLHQWGTWKEMNEQGARIDALSVSSIVEGVDYDCDTTVIECKHFDMEPKDFRTQYWDAVEGTNKQAHEIWKETHGCETCAKHWNQEGFSENEWGTFEGCDGITYVWDDCPDCEGCGAII